MPTRRPPIVGITTDLIDRNDRPTAICTTAYALAVTRAGAVPVLLPPVPGHAAAWLDACDAIVLTGGDDPVMEPFGVPTHPAAARVRPERQQAETELLERLRDRPDYPVLGVCLGMQMMSLVDGGALDQHLPDSRPDAARHWDHDHPVEPTPDGAAVLRPASVHSRHRQAITEPGRTLRVAAVSDDGLVEAVVDPARAYYLGVQWHPERTTAPELGQALFDRLVEAARAR